MPIINPLGINNETIIEIIDFMNDAKFNPKNQEKYFFDDSLSYYQQLCKMTKLLNDFQKAFAIVYQNELNLANNMVNHTELEQAIAELQEALELEITNLSTEMDTKFTSVNALLSSHTSAITTIQTSLSNLDTEVGQLSVEVGNLELEVENRLKDVQIFGTGWSPGSKTTVDGVEYLEINVEGEAGGTVTSVGTGTGLTGGPITSSGTISVDTSVVALKTDIPDTSDFIEKDDAPGYDDILTTASASTIYQPKSGMSGYISKVELPNYADLITATEVASTYTPLDNEVVDNPTLNGIADESSPLLIAYPSTQSASFIGFGTNSGGDVTIENNFDSYGPTGKTTGQSDEVAFDKDYFQVQNNHMQIKSGIYSNPSVVRSNINITANPTALQSYETWDTEEKYGYSFTVTVNGLTVNSMIENIVMSDVLMKGVAPIVKTNANQLVFYTESNAQLTGTIYTLITKEVS